MPTCRSQHPGRRRGDRIIECLQPTGHPGEHVEDETGITWAEPPKPLPPSRIETLRGRIQAAMVAATTAEVKARVGGREGDATLNAARVDAFDWVMQRIDELEAEPAPAEPEPTTRTINLLAMPTGPRPDEAAAMLDEADRLLGAMPAWSDNPGVKTIEIAQAQHLATRAQIGILRALLAGAR